MAVEVITRGPQPKPGCGWCFVCAYTWKHAVLERFADVIKQAEAAPDGGDPVLLDTESASGLPTLYEAVGKGLFLPLQHFGPLDLCWSHLTAITLKSASGLALPAPGMPAPGQLPGGMNGFPW